MRVTNTHFFPLAEAIINKHIKTNGINIKQFTIAFMPGDTLAAGYFDFEFKTIGLNIGTLANVAHRYKYSAMQPLRTAAAIIYEECYHATHTGTKLNTEDKASKYGMEKANKLPIHILLQYGGLLKQLTNNYNEEK